MSLAPGVRIGPYQIVSHVGSGGMGEVYKARDGKLDRDVAIKILPEAFSSDPDRLARFEREARAIAALSHPGILAIHDFGTSGRITYAVMELMDGVTLRARLDGGPIPPRKAVDLAAQVARALAAAHDKGIVHRDIKPENIVVTPDGRVKVLDFGLARLVAPVETASAGVTVTKAETDAGLVLGTAGYMSPEQVRGIPADHRSDIFSLGTVLYEMLTGRRPFAGDSPIETMNAILKQDAPPLVVSDIAMAPGLARVAVARPSRTMPLAAAAALVAVALGTGAFLGHTLWSAPAAGPTTPTFTRLTYERGTVWSGRFAPDAQTVVYAAAWDGGRIKTWLSRTDRPGSTALDFPPGSLLSMSRSGELALSIGHSFSGWMGEGTLARAPILGGAPREIAEHVREADWTPDGSALAIVRPVGSAERLEFPIGKTLIETTGYISHIRFSPDGKHIAFADHPLWADDNGDIAMVDLDGRKTTLGTGFQGLRGVAWSPDGREIWFTAANNHSAGVALRAVTLDGQARVVLSMPMDWRILDVAKDGRLLIATETASRRIELFHEGDARPKDLSLFDQSMGSAISPDGRSALITDQGSIAGTEYATYLRRIDQPTAVRLGEGQASGLSPDGRWALSIVPGPPSRMLLLPTGAGQPKELPNPDHLTIPVAAFMPDGRRIALVASQGTAPLRGYIQNIEDGQRVPFTPAGVNTFFLLLPLSPDGSQVWLTAPDGAPALYSTTGAGAPKPLKGALPNELPVAWSADGRSVYMSAQSAVPMRIFRVDLATGTRTLWKEMTPSQVAGLRLGQVTMTPDAQSVLYSYSALLSNLYVVDGLAGLSSSK
jgi:serine/threonine protein kinase